jgi:DNA-binding response OmpR family regulator
MSSRYAIIADSDRTFSGALRVQLDALGFVSFVALDARAVIEHMQQFTPGLVMLDVRLPGLGAYQACLHIRSLPGCSSLPIVLMADSNRPQIRVAAQRAGANVLLVKPFSMNDLMQRLEALGNPDDRQTAKMAVNWQHGVAEAPPMIWSPPEKPASAPDLSLGSQVLNVMLSRESKQEKP